jgi:hypothetical protein
MKFRYLLSLAIAFQIAKPAYSVDVTVYNSNLGLVREIRSINLKSGVNELAISDVPSQIDATSVHFKSLTRPHSLSVLEQNFQYDLVSQDVLLNRYIGKDIEVERIYGVGGDKKETIKGTLLSNQGGQVLQVGKKLVLNPMGSVVLPELPDGFLTKPTLLWKLDADKGGKHDCEISYLTNGMNWNADYVVVTSPKDDAMDLNTWVTITNMSGATFKDARLKLVAGDVHRAPQRNNIFAKERMLASEMDAFKSNGFTEKGFFEYHLYTLGRPTTLANNETKQIEMASASQVPLKKLYIYDGVQNVNTDYADYNRTDAGYGITSDKKVWVMLEFKNSKENNLGIPLPQGRVRVYKKDTDESLQFIGEDAIDHTPKDELVRIKMGNAFDVVGERTRTAFSSDMISKNKYFQETFEIKLRNHKEEDVTVNVVEHLYRWTNWKIVDSSQKFKKKDAQTIEYSVPVPKDGEAVVTYTVKYSW